MHQHGVLELAVATNDVAGAKALAESFGGIAYCDEREGGEHLPFRALATVATDDTEVVARRAESGLYVIYRRLKKEGDPNVVALFPIVRRGQLSHAQADAHWRDVHGPLALEHHAYMTHYSQLSVVATLQGPEFDGFALVGFDSLDDLRNRFFTGPGSDKIIADDVKQWADMDNSPPRLITREFRFAGD